MAFWAHPVYVTWTSHHCPAEHHTAAVLRSRLLVPPLAVLYVQQVRYVCMPCGRVTHTLTPPSVRPPTNSPRLRLPPPLLLSPPLPRKQNNERSYPHLDFIGARAPGGLRGRPAVGVSASRGLRRFQPLFGLQPEPRQPQAGLGGTAALDMNYKVHVHIYDMYSPPFLCSRGTYVCTVIMRVIF